VDVHCHCARQCGCMILHRVSSSVWFDQQTSTKLLAGWMVEQNADTGLRLNCTAGTMEHDGAVLLRATVTNDDRI
jgi:hypothetical protein